MQPAHCSRDTDQTHPPPPAAGCKEPAAETTASAERAELSPHMLPSSSPGEAALTGTQNCC